jgi:hypothetical protein
MENKKQRKKKIIGGLIAIIITFSVIITVLYWDEIKTAYAEWKANKAGWSEEDNFGSVEIETGEEVIIEQPTYETDALGIEYRKEQFTNLGYEFLIPREWEIKNHGSRLYIMHPDFKNNFSQIEISIIPLPEFEKGTSLHKLRNETITMLESSFRYHGYNDSFEIFTYNMQDATETGNGFLYHPLQARLKSMSIDYKIEPVFISYYTFIDNTGYVISGVGPKSKEIAIEEITKKVMSSFKKYEKEINIEEYDYVSLNEQCFLNHDLKQDVHYMINKNWELVYASNAINISPIGTHIYRLSNDLNSPEYNMLISISMEPKSQTKKVESYDDLVTELYVRGNYPEDVLMSKVFTSEDTRTSYKIYSEEPYMKGNKQGILSHYVKYFEAPMSEYYYNAIQVGNYPIKNYFYSINIDSKYDLVVNITHGSNNGEIAKEYLLKFIAGLSW